MVSNLRAGRKIKLPNSPDDFQCPGHDEILKRIFQILEVCSFATTGKGGCEECYHCEECRAIYDDYAHKGEDKALQPVSLIKFVERFGDMRRNSGRLL